MNESVNILDLSRELKKDRYQGKSYDECLALWENDSQIVHVSVSSTDIATYLMETPSAAFSPENPLTLYHVLSLTYRDPAFAPSVRAIAENIIDLSTGVDRPIALRGNPMYEMAFGVLVEAERFTQPEADAILDRGKREVHGAEILFGAIPSVQEVQIARNQDAIAAVRRLLEKAGTAYGEVVVLYQGALAALNAGQAVEPATIDQGVAKFAENMEAP